ncbi:MAG: cobalamin-binding protein [Gammaproteobacteria bacterium]|nr:cobalamin-binding protein [Gammaproteobacteria bacterium]
MRNLTIVITFLLFVCCQQVLAESTTPATSTKKQPQLPTNNAQRIVALAPHIVESLFDIGAGERIVGTVDYADYPEKALSIPRIGGYYGIQIEKVLALKPDLIIVWQSGNKAVDIERLKSLNMPLVFSNPKSIQDVAHELRLFGRLTNQQHNAEIKAVAFEQSLQRIKQQYSNQRPISVFYQLWSEPLMTVNKSTWIHQLIKTCGARNVFADSATDYPQLSIENVLLKQPQVIITADEKADKPQPVINWQKWSMIPAVKHNQFLAVNADLMHRFSARMLIGLEDMCEKIARTRQAISSKDRL